MGTLYLRSVPAKVLRKLRVRAKAERRSVAQEAIALLERAVEGWPVPNPRFRLVLDKLRRFREEARRKGKRFPSAEELVREDRDR